MDTIAGRLERFLGTWDPSLARRFFQYDRLLRSKDHRPPSAWGEGEAGPYWKELPRWLAERRGNGQGTVPPEFLDAVLWGQSCLFYSVRLQDDMLDGELPRSPLMMAPLLFLTEAQRIFESVIDGKKGFWERYRRALETTVAGITRVAELQRSPTARADDMLEAHGCVDAVLTQYNKGLTLTGSDVQRFFDLLTRGHVMITARDLVGLYDDLQPPKLMKLEMRGKEWVI